LERMLISYFFDHRDEGPGQGSPAAPRGSAGGGGGPHRQDPRPTMPSINYQRTSSAQQARGPELLSDDAVELQEQQLQEFNGRDGYHGGHDPTKAPHDQGSGNVYVPSLPRIGVNNNARAFARGVCVVERRETGPADLFCFFFLLCTLHYRHLDGWVDGCFLS